MSAVGRWISNILWIVLWVGLYFMCTEALGRWAEYIGIPILIVAMVIIWIVTDRRYERSQGE
jgi:hypothetical protein